jgi:glycerophosphoryl diester phosphodiesterase
MASLPLMLGHRGARASALVPENTFASFDLALRHGCDGFEFDVRLTACNRAVICHDPEVNGLAISKAGCEELKTLPDLQGVLARYARRAFLNIELKAEGLESHVLIGLEQHVPEKGYVVSSFLPQVLTQLRTRSGSVVLGFICDKRKQLESCQDLPVQWVIPHYSLITQELVERIHGVGRNVLAWTVNDKATILRLKCWGVDGIISDDSELLVQTLNTARANKAKAR